LHVKGFLHEEHDNPTAPTVAAAQRIRKTSWLTPTNALRKSGWYMVMSFDEDVGGVPVLDALRTYAVRLDEVYGKDAFGRFSRADMQMLGDRENRET
jgi:hypothetical protein